MEGSPTFPNWITEGSVAGLFANSGQFSSLTVREVLELKATGTAAATVATRGALCVSGLMLPLG